MEEFSTLLLNLYRAIYEVPYPDFQRYALSQVKSILYFDSAVWGVGSIAGSPYSLIHFLYLQKNESVKILENWSSGKIDDPLISLLVKFPGKTFLTQMPGNCVNDTVRSCIEYLEISHAASTAVMHDRMGIFSFISLYRTNPNFPFSEDDRKMKQNLTQHLVEVCERSCIRHMGIAASIRTERYLSLAASDNKGILCYAEPGFVDLLLSEWPSWEGPWLPAILIDSLGMGQKYCGTKIVIQLKSVQNLLFLRGRKRTPVDRLSPRESSVVKLFAQGMTYKQIAKDLELSPSTVRTHVSAAYDKLGVTNKVELVNILRVIHHDITLAN